jgi:signal transduction histidine kinase/ligand-binding sensor domain-containing protein
MGIWHQGGVWTGLRAHVVSKSPFLVHAAAWWQTAVLRAFERLQKGFMRLFKCSDDLIALAVRAAAVVGMLIAAVTASAEVELTQTSVLRRWDVNRGLPNVRVFSIAHTPDGFVWLGTYGGLARFDGVTFTTFTFDDLPLLGGDGIMALEVDDRGTLWIGTEEGRLLAHDAGGFRRIDVPVTSGHRINFIRSDGTGRLWLGTQDGVVVTDSTKSTCTMVKDGLEAADVTHVVVDSAGNSWAIAGGVLHRWRDDRWQTVAVEDAREVKVTALTAATEGGVWYAASATRPSQGRGTSLHRIDADDRVKTIPPGPWPGASIRSRIEAILEDDTGRLWCATRGSGVYRREADGTWLEPSKGTSLARTDGIFLSADATGSVWVGTRNSGVYQISPSRVESHRLPESVGDHVVTSVCARADGTLWAGTDGGGIVSWRDGATQRFGMDEGLSAPVITAVTEACGSRLYVGAADGVAVLDGERFVPLSLPMEAACNCLFTDRDDRLWVGTGAGVFVVGGAVADTALCGDGSPLDAMAFAQMQDDRIIALARSGSLFEFRDGRFHPIPDVADLSSRARAIAVDSDGAIWLGNYGSGITYIAGALSRRWSMQQNGLPSSHVLAIVPWADVMWICSENGVFGCPVAEFSGAAPGRFALPTWRVTETQGLPEKVCTGAGQPAASLGPDRRLWVPNGRYVAGFLPMEIMEPMPVFPPVVERIVADGLERPRSVAAEQLLPIGTERVEFSFTSPNTIAPQRLQFRHQLVGFDDDWVSVGDRRVASYTGLPPGRYTFRVEVGDPMGSWHSLREELHLRLPPRFWQRRDVQAAFACTLAASLAAAGWAWERRRSQARFARLALERAREQERQRIARDIHDDLGSGLTEIVMLSDVAEREAHATAGFATVRAIADRARMLTRAMDEVVWAVNPQNDSTEGFITYFHRWAQAYLGSAGLRVRWDLPIDSTDTFLTADLRHQLFLACKETVTNVVKHAAADEVRIACRVLPDTLEIVIEDDGRGFSTSNVSPNGDGLSNLRTRLAALGGECDIRSNPGRGTLVRFQVRIDSHSNRNGDGVK